MDSRPSVEIWFDSQTAFTQRTVYAVLRLALHAIVHFTKHTKNPNMVYNCIFPDVCKRVWPTIQHIKESACNNESCNMPLCIKFRICMQHWRGCHTVSCPICIPMRLILDDESLRVCFKNILNKAQLSFRKNCRNGRHVNYPTIQQLKKEE